MRKFIVIALLLSLVVLFYCCVNSYAPPGPAVYVGSEKCQSCHPKEFDLFKSSDHFHAMDTVSPQTVKADFNNSQFIYFGDTSRFYKRGNDYFVYTTDTSGRKKEFKVSYTFGWTPLQQYLVKFEDGRIQTLPFCWDTRDKLQGGQRWFHLYSNEKILPGDELFWMDINQNWNYMCADCHTTGYAKNFSVADNRFRSSWNESRVSCESCHGPGSSHLAWADKKNKAIPYAGFAISLAAKPVNWKMDDERGIRMPETVMMHDTLTETCARCHSRATRFSDDYQHGQSFLQTHIPSGIDTVNYYIDGQIKEEDYEYGSFLQSKMYAAGVTCMNCHEPHSMRVRAAGNALCASCHTPEKYDGPQHSYHQPKSSGNQCVSCHMPTTRYMGVDDRLDHSIRIPRPDLSLVNGTPNACNKCHSDKTVSWAAASFKKWFGPRIPPEKNYGELLYAISRNTKESEPSLFGLLQSGKYPAIIRASAMSQYGHLASERVSTLVTGELRSSNPTLRLHAIKAMAGYQPEALLTHLPPLLYDKVSAVRMEAMSVLAPVHSRLGESDARQFQQVMSDYQVVQEQMSHRPEGFFNRAILLNTSGSQAEAERLYLTCIQRFPGFIPSYANLIDLYREQNRENDAKRIVFQGVERNPGSAFLQYALGLWHIRQKDYAQGLKALQKAATLGPSEPQIVYGYAIGLFSTGEQAKALSVLELFLQKYGNQPLILSGLVSICHEMKLTAKEQQYANMLKMAENN